MGSQEQKTAVVQGKFCFSIWTIKSHHDTYLTGTNPHWNSSMQFLIKDLHQDILCLTVFDRDLFSPDGEVNKTNHHHFDILNISRVRVPGQDGDSCE